MSTGNLKNAGAEAPASAEFGFRNREQYSLSHSPKGGV